MDGHILLLGEYYMTYTENQNSNLTQGGARKEGESKLPGRSRFFVTWRQWPPAPTNQEPATPKRQHTDNKYTQHRTQALRPSQNPSTQIVWVLLSV